MSQITQAFTILRINLFERKLIIHRKSKRQKALDFQAALSKLLEGLEGEPLISNHKHQEVTVSTEVLESERCHFYLSWEQEEQFIESFKHRARQGDIATGMEIKEAYEKLCGFYVRKALIFRIMQEHGWSDVVPSRSH